MITRTDRRSSQGLSVTSPGVRSRLTCGFALASLAVATLNTSVAHANTPNTDICDPSSDYYIGGALCDDASTTTAPSSGGSGGGFSGWVSDFANSPAGAFVFFGGLAAFIAWVVIANLRESAAEKQQRGAAELARGRAIAEAAHAEQVQRAHAEAAAQVPPREVWDPHNVGLAPPPMPEPKIPAAPATTPEDLQRYATFGWAVPWAPGTAFAAAVSRSGNISRIEQAWVDACRLAGLGDTDEQGAFTPAATVVRVNGIEGSGDAWVAVDTRDYTVGAKQLDSVRDHLLRTARVESATPFERDAARDWFITVLSMDAPAARQATAPAAEEVQGPRIDPRWA
ncbi:hypothetical protein [Mycolicibacterium nivoides]|uniref:hypothetical protein n=1 Tax=Mycolicibacterium nivoides TaxID=2487344 RepID=UPI000F5BCBB3|nr:hypothetical protein [Mycolicibacterium nivoides]